MEDPYPYENKKYKYEKGENPIIHSPILMGGGYGYEKQKNPVSSSKQISYQK